MHGGARSGVRPPLRRSRTALYDIRLTIQTDNDSGLYEPQDAVKATENLNRRLVLAMCPGMRYGRYHGEP